MSKLLITIIGLGLLSLGSCSKKREVVEKEVIVEKEVLVNVPAETPEYYVTSTIEVEIDRPAGNSKVEVYGYLEIASSITMDKKKNSTKGGWLSLVISSGKTFCYQAQVGTKTYLFKGELIMGACDQGGSRMIPLPAIYKTDSLEVIPHDPELQHTGVVVLKVKAHE